ncbi:putative leucine-rich repeat receptor-like serine/threonine-protein kinase At2g24130 [Corylus avellana]|uniref:putative leucine-rich repeat receptor-like serine/threonine-protein kinase At2g24130 n=1 Tax=Corylus avellana TaxID=13451 RepID=UPI00286BBAC9|nr:putative leucine-rich repeat receptor-like serine/threonine-protein kinase At2g24130 [Corylus avellana]
MMLIERPSHILPLLGLLLVQSCMLELAQSSTNLTDQSALIAFNSKITSGSNETVLAGNWSTTTNFCNWIGISCSRRRQRVTALNLSHVGLQGTISPYIGNLSFLVSLDLSNNSFSGSLPHEIGRLHRLRILSLLYNNLGGSIPPTLQNCQNLREIHLAWNHLTTAIPSTLANISSLEILNLQDNNITGVFPLVIFNISSLIVIALTENHISGTPPMDLCSHCPNLQKLYISNNEFSGKLPSQMRYCRELSVLALANNKFDGSIPEGFGSLEKLELLYLGANNLTGNIPPSLTISNLSRLSEFDIAVNNIQGSIPSDLWRFPNLEFLNFEANKFTGHIPSYLSNCSKLSIVDFGGNLLSGPIPTSLGHLKYLERLYLGANQLTGEPENQELNILSSLSNCKFLTILDLAFNPLDITLPDSVGNFSTTLRTMYLSTSKIKGHIPMSIGSLKGLTMLDLEKNNLTGTIPSTIGGLEGLQRLYLISNKIEGFIPEDICMLKNLGVLSLSFNKISGSIPNCISNLIFLQELYLASNRLESPIPLNLWSLENLLFLNLSLNFLSGYLSPNIKTLRGIELIDLSWNQITGNIPSIIGTFESLRYLDLSRNSFQGDIPQSFGDLKGLDMLNLSYNNLSGVIPKSIEALSYLKYLNVSFNKLSGEIPSSGPFANFTAKSFSGNKALCGNPIFGVPPCPNPSFQRSKVKQSLLKYFVPVMASITICLALVYMLRRHRESKLQVPSLFNTLRVLKHRWISYQELCQGTNNFCESNLLGAGGFGSVYKGILFDGTIVAVKVLNLQLSGAFKSFDAECKVLRTIRHRNLVKVISTCSNLEFKALVLQYMSNGSLERWLYSYNYCLNLLHRVNIMVDVASALDYLHHGLSKSVVHCDLKPTNILLDDDMVAHVSDFGIAKILVENKDATQTKTLGTLGYIAPEYGSEGKVSIKSDVYSYGILLLEMITRKKPTDDMFVGELTLRQWINTSLPDRMMEVVDDGLLRMENGRDVTIMQSVLSSIMELGLRCSEDLPDERANIKDVLVKLQKIKLTLFENRNRGV